MNEGMQQYRDMLARDKERSGDQLQDALAEARKELDKIEEEYRKASRGEAYLSIGQVDGISAQAVFTAFGYVERLAEFDNYRAAEIEKEREEEVDEQITARELEHAEQRAHGGPEFAIGDLAKTLLGLTVCIREIHEEDGRYTYEAGPTDSKRTSLFAEGLLRKI